MSKFHECDKCAAKIEGQPWTIDIYGPIKSHHFRRLELCKSCKDKLFKGTPVRNIVKPLQAVVEGVILKGET